MTDDDTAKAAAQRGWEIMDTQDLKELVDARGPFVSIYFDDSRDSADGEEQIQARWRDLRKHLEEADVDGATILKLQRAVLQGEPGAGPHGRGLIVTADDVLVDENLVPPHTSIVRVSDYPYIVPLAELSRSRPTYVFAAVDHRGADITLHDDGTSRIEEVGGEGYPVHKPASAGWNGYGDVGHAVEEAVRINVRAVAERLTELVDETGAEVVFVCGEVRSRTDVISALPDRVGKRVTPLPAGAMGHRVREIEVAETVEEEFARRRQAVTAEAIERFEAEAGRRSGLVVEGIAAVCAALRDGAVKTLIVGENLGDVTVVAGRTALALAADADGLSEIGEAPDHVVRADEALPFAAIATDASLLTAPEGFAPADGIAALLRFASTTEG